MGVESLLFFVLHESHSYFYAYHFVQSDSSERHNPGEEMSSIRASCTLLSSTVSTPTVIVFLIHYSGVMSPSGLCPSTGTWHRNDHQCRSMQINHRSLDLHFFAFFIIFYLHIIQPEVLILFPSTVVQLDPHIWIGIWCIQVLHVGIC
jgi:hypothetical protein